MKHEIAVHDLDGPALHSELTHLVDHFRGPGVDHCRGLFGWPWGNEYYPTPRWETLEFPLEAIDAEVYRVESAELGSLGGDDLFLEFPSCDGEFQFCHHHGIHFICEMPNQVAAYLLMRWHGAGWKITQRDCPEEAGTPDPR
jgi:hypothetical protein